MILVTGGYGCIGAELVKWLLRNTDEEVLVGSRTVSQSRTDRVFHDVKQDRLSSVTLDVGDRVSVDRVFADFGVTRVAHLGALQTPDCNAHRDLGLQINLAGTQHLVEACKVSSADIERLVFASSIAVYGPRASYPEERVPLAADPNPVNVYGVWKLASEQVCKFYSDDTGVPTVCLRPGVLFGPGRDAGLTSTPTMAMKHVALGLPYEIPFSNKQDYLYAPDVGAAFANALLEPFAGYGVFTLPSETVAMPDVINCMKIAAEDVGLGTQFQITHGTDLVPFICDIEYDAFVRMFPKSPHTKMVDAMRETLTVYQSQVERGWLQPSSLG